jgi:hypothetical protein
MAEASNTPTLEVVSSAERPEPLELVVVEDGSGVVSALQLSRLGISPGAHLKVVPVDGTETPRRPRRSVRGALAGTAAVPSWVEFEEASRAAIEDVEARYQPEGRWASENP